MRQSKTTGLICLKDAYDFEYSIAIIEYTEREDETYTYSFRPNYSVISLLPTTLFQGIPGLNLDKHKEEYLRENMTPVFISERTPSEGREDLWQLLEACGMNYLNRLEWLIRTNMQYGGDPMYVKRFEPADAKQTIAFEAIITAENRSARLLQRLLREICRGNDIVAPDFSIDDSNRKQFYALLLPLYEKEKSYLKQQKTRGIQIAAAQGKYTGRKPIPIDDIQLDAVFTAYQKGRMDLTEAIEKLGVSRSTFYRRLREYKANDC
ncbi:MAG: recombinase family protein [Bacillota bacterium]|nr:recombinase family protein [Bacillota bacterium]